MMVMVMVMVMVMRLRMIGITWSIERGSLARFS